MRSSLLSSFQGVLKSIFRPGRDPWDGIAWGWVVAICALTLVTWGYFLQWGDLSFSVHDWVQEGPRYFFLREALLQGQLPLYIGTPLSVTDQFLSIPDTVIAPQVVLLRWLQPSEFILVDALLMVFIGALGMIFLARKLGWSAFTTSIAWLLFGLNGHITAQVAVGHTMWMSYFLLPYFVWLLLRLLKGQVGWAWVLALSLVALGLLLNGGYHFFLWMAMFLAILILFQPARWRTLLLGLAFSGLVGFVRLLPAAVLFWGETRSFIGGYPSLLSLVESMVVLKFPGSAATHTFSGVGWWELDAYVGLLGLIFLGFFGLVQSLRTDHGERILLAPAFVMLILAMGKIYQPITMLPLPLAGAERVSSRFIILPLVLLIVLAAHRFEAWQDRHLHAPSGQLLTVGLWGLMANDLIQHARLWRVENMLLYYDQRPFDMTVQVLERSVRSYELSLVIGLVVSGCSLLALLVLRWREARGGRA